MNHSPIVRDASCRHLSPKTLSRLSRVSSRRAQKGFTLIEAIVILLIVGIIVAIVAPKLLTSTNNAKALAYRTTAQDLANDWMILNENCGTSQDINTSDITTNPGSTGALQLLVDGTGLNAQYQTCYNNTNLRAMHDAIQGSSTDGYTLNNSQLSLSNVSINGKSMFAVSYTPVTNDILLLEYQVLSSAAGAKQATSTTIPSSDNSDPKLQFSSSSGSTSMMTIYE